MPDGYIEYRIKHEMVNYGVRREGFSKPPGDPTAPEAPATGQSAGEYCQVSPLSVTWWDHKDYRSYRLIKSSGTENPAGIIGALSLADLKEFRGLIDAVIKEAEI